MVRILVTLSMFHCYLLDFGYRPTNSHCLLDAAAGRNLTSGKVNGVNQGSDKGITSSSSNTPDTEVKSANSILRYLFSSFYWLWLKYTDFVELESCMIFLMLMLMIIYVMSFVALAICPINCADVRTLMPLEAATN